MTYKKPHKIRIIKAEVFGVLEVFSALGDEPKQLLRSLKVSFFAELLSKLWLRNKIKPYLTEIKTMVEASSVRGIYALNLSHRWCACTAGIVKTSEGIKLLYAMDWPVDGFGTGLIITKLTAPVGQYYSLTWPGFAGVVAGVAKGKFAISFNQAPARFSYLPKFIQMPLNYIRVLFSKAPPPAFLLREVFETCKTYTEAKNMLCSKKICLPATYTIAGEGEACIVERKEDKYIVHNPPIAVANGWINNKWGDRPTGRNSSARRDEMMHKLSNLDEPWAQYPIVNTETRFTLEVDTSTWEITAQAFEKKGDVTSATTII